MFPPIRQRLLIAVTIVLGAGAFSAVLPYVAQRDGATGLSLLDGDPWRIVVAMVVMAGAGLVAAVPAVAASVTGNPMAGVFGLAGALAAAAARAGPIDGWMFRHAEAQALPREYGWLMAELAVWQLGWIGVLLLIQRLRSPLRTRFPALAFTDHLGMDTQLRFPQAASLLAGLTATVTGGALAYLLLRTSVTGQVEAGLLIAFAVAGLMGQMMFPQNNPIGILLSPAVVGAVGYTWVLLTTQSTPQVLADWYTGRLPNLALALPVHYASAGVAGCALGIGWAQALQSANAPTSGQSPSGVKPRAIPRSPGA